MNAVKMLKQQHREIERLFRQFEAAEAAGPQQRAFEQIADALALHAALEERHFYPGVKQEQTEEILFESVEAHLEIKRAIADLLLLESDDEAFEAKVKGLKEDVEHHVEEEETALFPEVEKLIDAETLEAIGLEMEETEDELVSEGNPRDAVPGEAAAQL